MFDTNVLLNGPSSYVSLCTVLPSGPAVHLCDIFTPGTRMTPEPDWTACAHLALTLSPAILSQRSCQRKCTGKRLSSSSLHHLILVLWFRSVSAHMNPFSPQCRCFFHLSVSQKLFRLVMTNLFGVTTKWSALAHLYKLGVKLYTTKHFAIRN